MSNINVIVSEQNLHIADSPTIASQGVNEDYVVFSFDDSWAGFGKVALFYRESDENTVYESAIDANGKALIPYEVTSTDGTFCFGIAGVKDNIIYTSEIIKYKVVKGLYTAGQETVPPTPGIYEQILSLAGEITENVASILEDADEIKEIVEGIVTPIVSVTETETGVRITVTDKNGTTNAEVENGTATDEQVAEWLDEHPEATTTVLDGSITEEKLSPFVLAKLNGGGLTADVKEALLDCLSHVAWDIDDGQDYYNALEAALYPPANLVSISAVFNSGAVTIYDTNNIDDLKQYLTVTALYDDLHTEPVAEYVVSGSMITGTQTFIVTYAGKTTTFSVNIVSWVTTLTATYTQSGTVFTTDTLDSLKANLVVVADYADGTSETLSDNDYTLSGSLTVGISTITVSYGSVTDTFMVTVSSLVPSGYTMVDYISNETDNTAYAKTDFPSADVDAFDYEISITCKSITATSEDIPVGGRNSYSGDLSKKGFIIYTTTNAINVHYGNATNDSKIIQSGTIATTPTDKHTITLKQGKIYIDGEQKKDQNALYAMLSGSYKIFMFTRNNGGGANGSYKGRIYDFTVKDGNGDYVLRYIPVKRDSDDVYGFYDAIGQTFISAFTSAFTGGYES